MGWLEDLRGQVVGLDSAPLMYYLEGNQDIISRGCVLFCNGR
jgi:hypothetical protein